MKRISILIIGVMASLLGFAQSLPVIEGTSYYLPKTALKLTIKIEKTVFTPGEYADYANMYFHQGDEVLEGKTEYKILDMGLEAYGVPDTAKYYTAKISPKLSLQKLYTTQDGILVSVNKEPVDKLQAPTVLFANKVTQNSNQKPLNPRDYMTEEILSAGSKAKMAQLCAKEIKDIREARNEISRGQAETLPKDGEQLKLMMNTMDKQEKALMSLFTGNTRTETIVEVLDIFPEQEIAKDVIFRFSEAFGLCDADDLSGTPYYITVKDLKQTPEDTRTEKEILKQKDETGLFVNVPGRAKITIQKEEKAIISNDYSFPQFGRTDNVSPLLFAKKVFTSYDLNPTSGAMVNMKSEEVGK